MTTEQLTLDDILDARAYERVRDDFRRQVMARKRLRRLAVGDIMTLVFESVDTVRFQVQEMARVEKIFTDEGIQGELDVYNRLLPTPGELSATLFIELTTDADLRYWLPRLVGVERSVMFVLADGSAVPSVPEATHADALTREAVTPAVHYLRFPFAPAQVATFADGPVVLAVAHPEYRHEVELADGTRAALLGDLEGRTEPLHLR
jgi:hypothetical protein